jgi:glycosyltransferase involved in cell wall biosynthesis
MKRILFLYTEVAEYMLACIEHLAKDELEIHLVRWPINPEAPFQLRHIEGVKVYERNALSDLELQNLVKEFRPDVILTSGWGDKGYLKALKFAPDHAKRVLLFDNHWIGSVRQKVAALTSKWHVRKYFTHVWVPGKPQQSFAKKLGFSSDLVKMGVYCADISTFNGYYQEQNLEKVVDYPKNFLFVGRYLEFKGIFDLWNAFSTFHKEHPDWTLTCLGTGDLWEQRMIQEGIEHVGFVQPQDLGNYIRKAGVFILPSHKEPWGVVVHEMAAAGLPMIVSNEIGAASRFVEGNSNGFSFKSGNEQDLLLAMNSMALKSQKELHAMGKKSHDLAQNLTPEIWKETLLEFC